MTHTKILFSLSLSVSRRRLSYRLVLSNGKLKYLEKKLFTVWLARSCALRAFWKFQDVFFLLFLNELRESWEEIEEKKCVTLEKKIRPLSFHHLTLLFLFWFSTPSARRRAAAKRKKLKNLGKSKSTDTEEEDAEDDCGDDGELEQSVQK